METPDVIKKGLECCGSNGANADACPYMEHGSCWDCFDASNAYMNIMQDALDYIKQLEAERDAAVADITQMVQEPYSPCYCDYCKLTEEECSKSNCRGRNAFVWRGVQKEETDEND